MGNFKSWSIRNTFYEKQKSGYSGRNLDRKALQRHLATHITSLAIVSIFAGIGTEPGLTQTKNHKQQDLEALGSNEKIVETFNIEISNEEENAEDYNSLQLPKNSAIVCRVLMDTVMDPERRYSLPITLLTTLDVHDVNGEVAIPSNSIVSAIIQKEDLGDFITIERIVYRGLAVPINVDGRLIPAQIRPDRYGEYIEPPQSKASSMFQSINDSNLIPTLLGFALADSYNENSNSSSIPPILIGVLGAEIGINLFTTLFKEGPRKVPPLVEIQKDTLIVFTLTESLKLPESFAPESILTEQS